MRFIKTPLCFTSFDVSSIFSFRQRQPDVDCLAGQLPVHTGDKDIVPTVHTGDKDIVQTIHTGEKHIVHNSPDQVEETLTIYRTQLAEKNLTN